jgi:RHH-type proline utilization regulon transcriptional repressor/proline dehydrogenase/delta 1-pyrroline-5-carboxylate dehydrogenase
LNQVLETLATKGHEWPAGPEDRAAVLEKAAETFEGGPKALRGVDSDGDARRGGDYLRVYAAQIESEFTTPMQMAGPTGERNELSFWPKGTVACVAMDSQSAIGTLIVQTGAALAAGNTAVLCHPESGAAEAVAAVLHKAGVPEWVVQAVPSGNDGTLEDLVSATPIEVIAFAGEGSTARAVSATLADTDGPLRPLILFRETPEAGEDMVGQGQPVASSPHYLHRFVHERSLSIDTTASGGNASLLSIEDGPGLPGEA